MGQMSGDSKKLPVPYYPSGTSKTDAHHQTEEWTSGKRGGGSVPKDLEWRTNPKQKQEEDGTNGTTGTESLGGKGSA